MLSILGKIWALPTTVIGLVVAVLPLPFFPFKKTTVKFAHNAICFYNHPFLFGKAVAVTLGNVILFQYDHDYFNGDNVGEHEMQHTLQAEMLGIFYLPAHIICLIWYMLIRKNPKESPLERGPYSHPPRPF